MSELERQFVGPQPFDSTSEREVRVRVIPFTCGRIHELYCRFPGFSNGLVWEVTILPCQEVHASALTVDLQFTVYDVHAY